MAFENHLAPSVLAGGDQSLPVSCSKRFVETVAQNDYLANALQKVGMYAAVDMYLERNKIALAPLDLWRSGQIVDPVLLPAHVGPLWRDGRQSRR